MLLQYSSAALRRVTKFTLADESRVTCGADLIALTDDGKLSYCKLAKPRTRTPTLALPARN